VELMAPLVPTCTNCFNVGIASSSLSISGTPRAGRLLAECTSVGDVGGDWACDANVILLGARSLCALAGRCCCCIPRADDHSGMDPSTAFPGEVGGRAAVVAAPWRQEANEGFSS